ncbi:MAG: recombinase RecA, partial [Phycisphaerae bacterium]
DLIERRIQSGDVLSNANTIIMIGKTRDGNRMGRALYISKHRGSACEDQVLPYEFDDTGFRFPG